LSGVLLVATPHPEREVDTAVQTDSLSVAPNSAPEASQSAPSESNKDQAKSAPPMSTAETKRQPIGVNKLADAVIPTEGWQPATRPKRLEVSSLREMTAPGSPPADGWRPRSSGQSAVAANHANPVGQEKPKDNIELTGAGWKPSPRRA